MTTDNYTQRLVLALVVTVLVGHIALTYPSAIEALTLCAAVFVAAAAVLKL